MARRINPLYGGIGLASVGEVPVAGLNRASAGPSAGRLSQQPKPRQAMRACDICRQMKVKCDGFDNPPCVRCRKSGRDCSLRFLPYSRDQHPDCAPHNCSGQAAPVAFESRQSLELGAMIQKSFSGDPLSSTHSNQSDAFVAPGRSFFEGGDIEQAGHVTRSELGTYGENPSRSVSAQNLELATTIPSIYSSSPLDAMNEQVRDGNFASLHSQTSNKRLGVRYQGHEQDALWNFTSNTKSQTIDCRVHIPRRDLRGMIKIFCEKLLPNIPALSLRDFKNTDQLIETEFPLVCCMCYVTARFLSGGKQLREILIPQVAQILKGKFSSGRQTNEMSTLRALIILYGYANTPPPSPQESETDRPEEILYWPLKSLVEVYALRLSLNRAVYDLEVELRSERSKPITESLSYQKYTCWLQLFTLAKYASVVSGTPPSIPIDWTIRAGPLVMDQIGLNSQAGLFGEAELSIIWEKIGTNGQLGEWWCPGDPSKIIDECETESVLREADQLIDVWYNKWASYINDDEGRGAKLDFHGRCARFWINCHATRHLQSSPAGLTDVQKNQVRKCVVYASRVLDWPLDLSPFQKEALRYVPESGSIMVSYCCLYIIASCQTFGSTIPDLFTSLGKVVSAAHLMLDMAPDAEHSAHAQSLLILRRVEALQKHLRGHEGVMVDASESSQSTMPPVLTDNEPIGELHDFNLHDEGMSGLDLIWDFPVLTPRIW